MYDIQLSFHQYRNFFFVNFPLIIRILKLRERPGQLHVLRYIQIVSEQQNIVVIAVGHARSHLFVYQYSIAYLERWKQLCDSLPVRILLRKVFMRRFITRTEGKVALQVSKNILRIWRDRMTVSVVLGEILFASNDTLSTRKNFTLYVDSFFEEPKRRDSELI